MGVCIGIGICIFISASFFGLSREVPTYGLPHGSFAWAARLHPTVRRVFADLPLG